jgi:hypothetical protein
MANELKDLLDQDVDVMDKEQMRKVIRQLKTKLRAATKAEKREAAPSSDQPQTELQRLTKEHWRLTQHSVRLSNGVCDKKCRCRGEDKACRACGGIGRIPCRLPHDVIQDQQSLAEQVKDKAKALEGPIEEQLKLMEIYRAFLHKVFGCGPIIAAYLVSNVDIRRDGLKPSSVRRYCGYAVINGRAERPRKEVAWMLADLARAREPHALKMPKNVDEIRVNDEGQEEWLVRMPIAYNTMLKSRMWQMMQAMRKNAAKCTNDAPYGVTNKYLEIWYAAKWSSITIQHMTAGKADQKGLRKAVDIFLSDFYTLWRSMEGLPIWPSYYDSRRGELHGGIPLEDRGASRHTLESALKMVGNFEKVPLQEKRCWTMSKEEPDPLTDEEEDAKVIPITSKVATSSK